MSADRRGGAMRDAGTSVRRPLPGGAGPRALRLMPGRQKACIKSASDRINPHHRDAGAHVRTRRHNGPRPYLHVHQNPYPRHDTQARRELRG